MPKPLCTGWGKEVILCHAEAGPPHRGPWGFIISIYLSKETSEGVE